MPDPAREEFHPGSWRPGPAERVRDLTAPAPLAVAPGPGRL